ASIIVSARSSATTFAPLESTSSLSPSIPAGLAKRSPKSSTRSLGVITSVAAANCGSDIEPSQVVVGASAARLSRARHRSGAGRRVRGGRSPHEAAPQHVGGAGEERQAQGHIADRAAYGALGD